MPPVDYGADIEFHVPEKPFLNPSLLEDEEDEEEQDLGRISRVEDNTPVVTNNIAKTTAAVYDRNWLLQ